MTAELHFCRLFSESWKKGTLYSSLTRSLCLREEEFKRTINITDALLDNQQRKLIRNGSVFAGSLSALTPYKLRGGQERRSCS